MDSKALQSPARSAYEAPRLVHFGSVEDLTKGPASGWIDVILGTVGIGDGDGGYRCPDGSWYSSRNQCTIS